MGANITTFVDTLFAAVLLEHPADHLSAHVGGARLGVREKALGRRQN